MFTVQYREEVREKIINTAKGDHRIVSAAVIGSYASGKVDKYSDIDLTFGVAESFVINTLLDSWTEYMTNEFKGIMLFDLQSGHTTYRVFILPGCLQVDLSLSPASQFGAVGPHFILLWGNQNKIPQINSLSSPNTTREFFGYVMHHILRARFCMERNNLPLSEYWINEARNYTIKLGCSAQELKPILKEPNKEEIIQAIQAIVLVIPTISEEVKEYAHTLKDTLSELSSDKELV